MKKLVSLITIALLIILTGCSGASSPTKVVDGFLKEFQKDPLSSVNDQFSLDGSSEEEKALFTQLSAMLKKQTYTLDNEQIDGDTATVDVHYKTYDYVTPLQEALNDFLAQAIAAAFSGSADEEELSNLMSKIYAEKLAGIAESDPVNDFDYTLHLNKVGGQWQLEDLSNNNEFIDGYLGGLVSAFNNLGNNLGY